MPRKKKRKKNICKRFRGHPTIWSGARGLKQIKEFLYAMCAKASTGEGR